MDNRAVLSSSLLAWDKIFRRSLIEQYYIRFPEGKWADDVCFSKCYASVGSKVRAIFQKYYVDIIRSGQVSVRQRKTDPRAVGR